MKVKPKSNGLELAPITDITSPGGSAEKTLTKKFKQDTLALVVVVRCEGKPHQSPVPGVTAWIRQSGVDENGTAKFNMYTPVPE